MDPGLGIDKLEPKNKMMKFKTILSVGALLLTLSSCENLLDHDRAGEAVTFGASSDHNGVVTKTAYSGVISGGKERIDWVDGDQVRIFMYTHNANSRSGNASLSFKDYSVVNIQSRQQKSVGQLSAVDGKLAWSEGLVHDFYSFYPPQFGGYNSQMEYSWYWQGSPTINFTLPSSQNGEATGDNMENLYMAAVAEGYTSEGRGSVVLEYYPLVTTLHFTFRNDYSSQEPLTISQVTLAATNWQPITGVYSASISGGRFVPNADNAYGGSTSITLSSSKTIQYGEAADYVFFIVPRTAYNPDNLKLTLTTNHGQSSIQLTNSQVSAFESCQKYFLNMNLGGDEPTIEVTPVAQVLATLSDSPYLSNIEYLPWKNPAGLYYKDSGRPISGSDMAALLASVTSIYNDNNDAYNYLLKNLTPEDFAVFPNLTSIHLTGLGNTETISVENLNNLLEMAFSSNASHVTVSNCSFDASNAQPLVLKATKTMEIDINNVSGLSEVHLVAGDGGGGNVGDVNIHDCPDLKVIKVYRDHNNGHIKMKRAEFSNLPALETIFLDQANYTESVSVSNCDALVRFIIANQENWLLKSISLTNLPVLGDSAPDSSEYGLTGFNVERVAMDIRATKVNCPNLGPSFKARQSSPGDIVDIMFQ